MLDSIAQIAPTPSQLYALQDPTAHFNPALQNHVLQAPTLQGLQLIALSALQALTAQPWGLYLMQRALSVPRDPTVHLLDSMPPPLVHQEPIQISQGSVPARAVAVGVIQTQTQHASPALLVHTLSTILLPVHYVSMARFPT
jgi:hypothetical protein